MSKMLGAAYKKILKNYKAGLVCSFVVLAVLAGVVLFNMVETGYPVERGIDFTGGTQASIDVVGDITAEKLTAIEDAAASQIGGDIKVRLTQGLAEGAASVLMIESGAQFKEDDIGAVLSVANVTGTDISIRLVGAALGGAFWSQAMWAIFFAFLAMAIVIFFTFKTVVPSLAVVLAAISDITVALAGMNLFGIKLSLASLAGLLMLIGYSVDTDILLSTRVLKRAGDVDAQILSSVKTGLLMTTASIAAVVVLFLVSASSVLKEIAAVMIFGLLADILFTWVQNAGILKWYVLAKEARHRAKENQEK